MKLAVCVVWAACLLLGLAATRTSAVVEGDFKGEVDEDYDITGGPNDIWAAGPSSRPTSCPNPPKDRVDYYAVIIDALMRQRSRITGQKDFNIFEIMQYAMRLA